MRRVAADFAALTEPAARERYRLGRDTGDWKVLLAQADVHAHPDAETATVPILYRPFDARYTYYTGQSRGFICRPRQQIMRHMLAGTNIGLSTTRGNRDRRRVGTRVCFEIPDAASHRFQQGSELPVPALHLPAGRGRAGTGHCEPYVEPRSDVHRGARSSDRTAFHNRRDGRPQRDIRTRGRIPLHLRPCCTARSTAAATPTSSSPTSRLSRCPETGCCSPNSRGWALTSLPCI